MMDGKMDFNSTGEEEVKRFLGEWMKKGILSRKSRENKRCKITIYKK